jgi:hypothetical protein
VGDARVREDTKQPGLVDAPPLDHWAKVRGVFENECVPAQTPRRARPPSPRTATNRRRLRAFPPAFALGLSAWPEGLSRSKRVSLAAAFYVTGYLELPLAMPHCKPFETGSRCSRKVSALPSTGGPLITTITNIPQAAFSITELEW